MKKFYNKVIEISYALKPPVIDWSMRTFHVSFAIYKNRIVSIGTNKKKTNPNNLRNPKINAQGINISSGRFTCSEYSALRKIKQMTNIPFEKVTLINVRIDRENCLAFAAPCSSCLQLCSFFDIRNIYYTNNNGQFVKL